MFSGLRDMEFVNEYKKFLAWSSRRIPSTIGNKPGMVDTATDIALQAAKQFEQSATMTFFDYQLWLQRFSGLLMKDRGKAIAWAKNQLKYALAKDRAIAKVTARAGVATSSVGSGLHGTTTAGLFGGQQTFVSVAQRMYIECGGSLKTVTAAQKRKLAESIAIIACVHSKSNTLALGDFVNFEKTVYAQMRKTPVPERVNVAGRILVTEAARLKNERKKAQASATAASRSARTNVTRTINRRSKGGIATARSATVADCCPDMNTRFQQIHAERQKGRVKPTGPNVENSAAVRSTLPDGVIDHRAEGICPKTGDKMTKVWIRGENPQEVWYAESSRVVMPIRAETIAG